MGSHWNLPSSVCSMPPGQVRPSVPAMLLGTIRRLLRLPVLLPAGWQLPERWRS